jgi:dihydrodipicolinate synthase/N-acetylneuraminate lyase
MDRNDVTWKGFFPALTTPFKRDGSLDKIGWRVLLQLMLEQGMHGVVVAGTSGEWYAMTNSERKKLLEIAVEEIGGHIPVIAGVSAFRLEDVIGLAQHAHKAGADGVLFTPTPYAVPSPAEVLAFYRSVSDRIDLPIIVYNWARGTGVEINVQLAMQLAEVDKVVAIKDSTTNRADFFEKVRLLKDKLIIFGSFVNPIGLACLRYLGGDGWIGGGALLGRDLPNYFNAVWKNDYDRALLLAKKWWALSKQLFRSDFGGVLGSPQATLKAAMNLMGQPGGYTRPPYLPLDENAIKKLKVILSGFL